VEAVFDAEVILAAWGSTFYQPEKSKFSVLNRNDGLDPDVTLGPISSG
jgi:hypothetical protein